MTVEKFASKYKMSSKDKAIAKKIYGDADKTESQWITELRDKFVFDYDKADKILKVKEIKSKSSNKNDKKANTDKSKAETNNKK